MKAIYKKELQSLFHSMIGWLFAAALLFFISIYFAAYNLMYCSPSIASAISSVGVVLIVIIPILTMRILAEERKQKTDQLILTAPVSIGKIVLGKYFALITALLIPTAVVCTYPLIMSAFGEVGLAECYTAIWGFFLYAAAGIAVGVFLSSITESQIIAAVMTFAVLLVTYIMGGITSLISSTGNIITIILGQFDFYEKFVTFLSGSLQVESVVYFLSIIALFLFLTTQSIQKRRFSVSSRTFSISAFSSATIVAVLVLVVLVNMIATQLPASIASIDMTKEKLYSITDDTKELVKNLNEDVTIYVLNNENNQDDTVAQTLQSYADLSNHIKIEYKDPVKYPNFYLDYTNSALEQNSLVVVSDKRSKAINYYSLYETQMDYTTYSTTTTGYDAEGQITSAISYVTSDELPKVYIIEGHDEMTLEAEYQNALEKENIETESINLLQYENIPEDAKAIMILSPISDFSSDDADKVIAYLQKGGRALITTGVTDKDMANFKRILEYYHITLHDGMIVEGDTNHYYSNPFYILPDVASDNLTSGIYGSKYIFAPYAQAMTVEETEDVSVTPLLTTTESSYNKADINNMESYEKKEGDLAGPFNLGMLLEKQEGDTTSVAAVFSSEALFTASASEMVSGANLQLFSNIFSEYADHEVTVSIPVKSMERSTLTVTKSSFIMVTFMTVVVIPFGAIVTGFVIWFKRRRR